MKSKRRCCWLTAATTTPQELASACHLSLDRGYVYTDNMTGVPYVLLHIHGVRSGA